MVERIYSKVRHLGRKRKFRKCQGDNWGIWERIQTRYEGHKETEKRRKNV